MNRHYDLEQRTPEWYKLRLGIPTASAFHKVVTPKTLKLSDQRVKYRNLLLAEWMTGKPLDADEYLSKSMEAGIDNEDRARIALEEYLGVETKRGGFFTSFDGMAGCSPDGLIGSNGDVEIKCREIQTQIGFALDGFSNEHVIQIQTRLLIEEREFSWLFNYNSQLFVPPAKLPRDDKTIAIISGAMRQFIEELLVARLDLEQRFGPFVRPEPEQIAEASEFISVQDGEDIIATKFPRAY